MADSLTGASPFHEFVAANRVARLGETALAVEPVGRLRQASVVADCNGRADSSTGDLPASHSLLLTIPIFDQLPPLADDPCFFSFLAFHRLLFFSSPFPPPANDECSPQNRPRTLHGRNCSCYGTSLHSVPNTITPFPPLADDQWLSQSRRPFRSCFIPPILTRSASGSIRTPRLAAHFVFGGLG